VASFPLSLSIIRRIRGYVFRRMPRMGEEEHTIPRRAGQQLRGAPVDWDYPIPAWPVAGRATLSCSTCLIPQRTNVVASTCRTASRSSTFVLLNFVLSEAESNGGPPPRVWRVSATDIEFLPSAAPRR
jgi:hypothetical protein